MITDYYKRQIIALTARKYNGIFDDFKNKNPDLQTFMQNAEIETVASHEGFRINQATYNSILANLSKEYPINLKPKAPTEILTEKKEKIKVRKKTKINEKKISGFVDALIIAFITGSFIGIILLNIYSKIVQHL